MGSAAYPTGTGRRRSPSPIASRFDRSFLDDRTAVLVEKNPNLVAFVALDGALLYLNPSGRAKLGLEHLERIETIADLLFGESARPRWWSAVLRGVSESGEWSGECLFLDRRAETPVSMESTALVTLRDGAGRPLELVVEARDPTAQVRAERQRVEPESEPESAKLEAVGRLAGGIAHDFNNLLTAMIGFGEILLDHFEPGHPLREGAEQTLKTCMRSAGIVRQLLALSRRQVLRPVVLNVNDQVRELVKLLGGLIPEDVRFSIELGEPAPLVRADPARIEQVLLNLIVNARDAMPRGGTLTISTGTVELQEGRFEPGVDRRPGPHVRFSVSDTGHGMDGETLARVFEPFFTTKGEKGTGLGLATVYGIVRQSGGQLSVESAPGEGTTFSVFLPEVRATEQASAERASPKGRSSAGETVLLVEDDTVVRLIVRDTLRRDGYTVLEAADGDEARRLAADHPAPIHLLLTDVVMPGLSPVELIRHVDSRHPGLRTLYMSGHADEALRDHGLRAGEKDYLEKPFTRGELTRKVRETLDS